MRVPERQIPSILTTRINKARKWLTRVGHSPRSRLS